MRYGRIVVGFGVALVLVFSPANALASDKPDSPTYFRTSALGDLADIRKDIADAGVSINKGGKWRLLGNAAEIAFNIGQLKSLNPPTQYLEVWNKELNNLDKIHEKFMTGITENSVTQSRGLLAKMLNQVATMEKFVRKVK